MAAASPAHGHGSASRMMVGRMVLGLGSEVDVFSSGTRSRGGSQSPHRLCVGKESQVGVSGTWPNRDRSARSTNATPSPQRSKTDPEHLGQHLQLQRPVSPSSRSARPEEEPSASVPRQCASSDVCSKPSESSLLLRRGTCLDALQPRKSPREKKLGASAFNSEPISESEQDVWFHPRQPGVSRQEALSQTARWVSRSRSPSSTARNCLPMSPASSSSSAAVEMNGDQESGVLIPDSLLGGEGPQDADSACRLPPRLLQRLQVEHTEPEQERVNKHMGVLDTEIDTGSSEQRLSTLQQSLASALQCPGDGVQPMIIREPTPEERTANSELEEAILRYGLSYKQALAYRFVHRLGSLDNAFKYFDYNASGSFATVTWETGLLILHMGADRISRESGKAVFPELAAGATFVAEAAWEAFFDGIESSLPPLPWSAAANLEISPIKKRRSFSADDAADNLSRSPRFSKSGQDDDLKRKWHQEEPGRLRPMTCHEASHDGRQGEYSEGGSLYARPGAARNSDAQPRAAAAATATSAASMSSESPRRRFSAVPPQDSPPSSFSESPRRRLSRSHLATKPPASSRSRDIALPQDSGMACSEGGCEAELPARQSEASCEAEPGTHNAAGSATSSAAKAEEADDFRSKLRLQCDGLKPDRGLLLPLSRWEKSICMEMVKELGLWSCGVNSDMLIVREGSKAQQLRSSLQELPVGELLRVPGSLGHGLVNFGRVLSERLHFCTWQDDETAESNRKVALGPAEVRDADEDEPEEAVGDLLVLNDQATTEDLAQALSKTSLALSDGEQREFPPSASQALLAALKQVAAEKGYTVTMPTKGRASFTVGNLSSAAEVPGKDVQSSEERGGPHDQLQAGGAGVGALAELQRVDETTDTLGDEHPQSREQGVAGKIFEAYAHGRWGVHKYLRRSDLQHLVEDSENFVEGSLPAINTAYNEALQLQVEMTKARHGLTKSFFVVFLDKAMTTAGWRPSQKVVQDVMGSHAET